MQRTFVAAREEVVLIEDDRRRSRAYRELGEALAQAGFLADALEAFRQAADIATGQEEKQKILIGVIPLLLKSGYTEEARERLRELVWWNASSEKLVEVFFLIGKVLSLSELLADMEVARKRGSDKETVFISECLLKLCGYQIRGDSKERAHELLNMVMDRIQETKDYQEIYDQIV